MLVHQKNYEGIAQYDKNLQVINQQQKALCIKKNEDYDNKGYWSQKRIMNPKVITLCSPLKG